MEYISVNRILIIILFISKFSYPASSQFWNPEQIQKANTAKDISYLTDDEKEIVLYINLARLYPNQFMKYELRYNKDTIKTLDAYEQSLYKTLKKMKALPALQFDSILYKTAQCLANEQSSTGKIGHARTNKCVDRYSTGENCNYGSWTGAGHVMALLIDRGISGVGHRKNIIDKEYTKVGTFIATHPKFSYVAVIDFK